MRFSVVVLIALLATATEAPIAAPTPIPTDPPIAPTLAPTAVPATMLPPHPIPVMIFSYSLTACNSAVLLAMADAY